MDDTHTVRHDVRIRPFHIDIPDADLDDLRHRLARTSARTAIS